MSLLQTSILSNNNKVTPVLVEKNNLEDNQNLIHNRIISRYYKSYMKLFLNS